MSRNQNVVHLPSPEEMEDAKVSSRTLSKYASADRVQMSLRGSNGESDELVLPGHILQILLNVLSEMAKGNAINLMHIKQELSTQDAANILNVSRPYLVKLLEEEQIPFHKVGSHRRVFAQDVLNYKAQIDEKRKETLDSLAALSQESGMGYEI